MGLAVALADLLGHLDGDLAGDLVGDLVAVGAGHLFARLAGHIVARRGGTLHGVVGALGLVAAVVADLLVLGDVRRGALLLVGGRALLLVRDVVDGLVVCVVRVVA